MTINTGLIAFYKPENIETRRNDVDIIHDLFKYTRADITSRDIAKTLGWELEKVKKRVSDLINGGKISIVGIKKEIKNKVRVYRLIENPSFFPEKKLTRVEILKKVLDKYLDDNTYNGIIDEYERQIKLNN